MIRMFSIFPGFTTHSFRCLCMGVFLLWLSGFHGKLWAQEVDKEPPAISKPKINPSQWVYRWQPLGLIDPFDMNLTLGVEYAYHPKRSLTFDAGYIFASQYGSGSDGNGINPARGVLLRGGHRFYLGPRKGSFLDTDLQYKGVRYRNEAQWIWRGVVNGIPAYEEWRSFDSKKKVWIAAVKFGVPIDFGRRSPLGVEFWVGFGVRNRTFSPDLPADASLSNQRNFIFNFNNFGESTRGELSIGFRMSLNPQKAKQPRKNQSY
jgi:hypothetical protein